MSGPVGWMRGSNASRGGGVEGMYRGATEALQVVGWFVVAGCIIASSVVDSDCIVI